MLTDTLTQTYLIWDALLKHINQKSRNHPHYEYWKAMAEGASNLTPFTKHLGKVAASPDEGKEEYGSDRR
jgi:hypothetical protein